MGWRSPLQVPAPPLATTHALSASARAEKSLRNWFWSRHEEELVVTDSVGPEPDRFRDTDWTAGGERLREMRTRVGGRCTDIGDRSRPQAQAGRAKRMSVPWNGAGGARALTRESPSSHLGPIPAPCGHARGGRARWRGARGQLHRDPSRPAAAAESIIRALEPHNASLVQYIPAIGSLNAQRMAVEAGRRRIRTGEHEAAGRVPRRVRGLMSPSLDATM